MTNIKLTNGNWSFDPNKQLGASGGFGSVYLGEAPDGQPVAVKQIKLSAAEAAHRELHVAKELYQKEHQHVIPILDAGYDADTDRYYVVMAKAERSLQDYIDSTETFPLPTDIACNILLSVAKGLQEVGILVHRDLKPGNILYHDANWKIADFGIARFVEESTSLNTLRSCLSPQYAAPEQWALETATHATDLYALGCIAYALLTKFPPFSGNTEELQHKHRYVAPPILQVDPPQMSLLITGLLRKPPASRPSIERVISALNGIVTHEPPSPIPSSLSKVGIKVEQSLAEQERKAAIAESIRVSESHATMAARECLVALVNKLFGIITTSIPSVRRRSSGNQELIEIGNAALSISLNYEGMSPSFRHSNWKILHSAKIELTQRSPNYIWSANLMYSDLGKQNGFRWFEVAFFDNPLMGRSRPFAPFYLPLKDVDMATSQVVCAHCIAFGPAPIDDEDSDKFIERWCDLFAKAVEGRVTHPREIPIK